MSPAAAGLHDVLRDPRRYERQIDRLHQRFVQTRHLYEIDDDEVSLATIALHRRKVARLLARTVHRGEFIARPARLRTIEVKGKERTVFAYRTTDAVVHGAVANLIEERMAPILSPQLYSYRRGRSWWTAVSEFADYVREQRRREPDPRNRHLYVARRDVDSYTDSIPVWAGSPVWPMVRRLLERPGRPGRPSDWALVEKVIRPEVTLPTGATVTMVRGVATGQPISCVLFNLYLHELDDALGGVAGGFYGRYSDDIVFAHPDPSVVRDAALEMDRVLARLQLVMKQSKSQDLYLTAAARPSAEWPEARGVASVPFLGVRVGADATVSLNKEKTRDLLHEVEDRAFRTARSCAGAAPHTRGRMVCGVVNRVLNPRAAVFEQQTSAAIVRRAVTDRRQLEQLDYWIARIVLHAVTGSRDVRTFRSTPYRAVREEWGLESLLHARNTWGRET